MCRKHTPANLSLHHRKCKCRGGSDSPRNTIWLPRKVHQKWHDLFGSMLPHEIAEKISEKLIDPDYKFVCIRR
jgi:hypothetical protein